MSDYDKTLDNLTEKNDPMTRIGGLGKINKYMREYDDRKLSKFDKILLKGFYVKRHQNPDEILSPLN